MPGSGLWLRVFLALLLAVLPPLLLLLGAVLLTDSVLANADPDLVALSVAGAAIVWAAVLAILYARALGEDVRSLVALARHGPADDGAGDAAYGALASSLEERNHQVGALARESRAVPIDEDPRRVATAIVSSVRTVMRDATWRCAVLDSERPELLPAGVYHDSDDATTVERVGDLERWASTTSPESPARRIEGPWGAFAVVDVAAESGIRAILYAPWEGRPHPTRAELDLLSLVGQHAGAALEHSLLYARVRSQADELNRMASLQADFLRGVTHDLQTPLTSIGALAVELQADPGVPDGARADLESMAHQAERLRRMVSQLLVASRLEAGAVVPVQEVFAIRPLIDRTWSALRTDRPFALTVEGPPHLAVGDPDRIEQVLWALLDNAVKYSPPGTAIDVRVVGASGRLRIEVHDRGMGMAATTLERAFDQFYRAEEARRLAPDGSGIGLYAARGLMRTMGGDVSAESRLGDGTTAIVTLPAEPADREPP